jgi:hypothetical protein
MNVYPSEHSVMQAKTACDKLAALGLSFIDDIHFIPEKLAESVRS